MSQKSFLGRIGAAFRELAGGESVEKSTARLTSGGGFANRVAMGYGNTRNAYQVGLGSYEVIPQLQAAVRLIANRVASFISDERFQIIDTITGESLEAHPLEDLLRTGAGASSRMYGYDIFFLATAYILITGSSYTVKGLNSFGIPVSLVPIPPDEVTIVGQYPDRKWQVHTRTGANHTFSDDEMLWIRDPALRDPYWSGAGIGSALANELGADEAAATLIQAVLINGAVPDFVVSGDDLQEDQVGELKAFFEGRSGPKNAGRSIILNGSGINIDSVQRTFEELKINDLREWSKKFIRESFGIPPELMGNIENSNRATIDSAELIFARNVIRPLLTRFQASINVDIMRHYEGHARSAKFVFDDPVAEDVEAKRKYMTDNPTIFTIKERRAEAGFGSFGDPRDDLHLGPINVTQVAPMNPPDVEPTPAADQPASVRAVSKAIGNEDAEPIADAAISVGDTQALSALIVAAMRERAFNVAEDVGVNLIDDFDARVDAYLRDNFARQVQNINETTRAAIVDALRESARLLETEAQSAARLRSVFRAARENRAETIARTEVGRAREQAALDQMRGGGVRRKQWISSRDGRVRDTHSSLDGQVQGISEPFESPSGATGLAPRNFGVADEDINCRCVSRAVISGETRDMSDADAFFKVVDDESRAFEDRAIIEVAQFFSDQEEAALSELERLSF